MCAWDLLPDVLVEDVYRRLHVRDRAALLCVCKGVARQVSVAQTEVPEDQLKALWFLQKRLASFPPQPPTEQIQRPRRQLSTHVREVLLYHPDDPTVLEFCAVLHESHGIELDQVDELPSLVAVKGVIRRIRERLPLDAAHVATVTVVPEAFAPKVGQELCDALTQKGSAAAMREVEASPILGPLLLRAMELDYLNPFTSALIYGNSDIVAYMASHAAHAHYMQRMISVGAKQPMWTLDVTIKTLRAAGVRLPSALLEGVAHAALEQLNFKAFRAYIALQA